MARDITVNGKTYNFEWEDFDEDINVDSLLKIDLSNLIGEIVSFPVMVNRLGVMVAAVERKIGEQKIMLDLYEAKLKDRIRRDWTETKAPTVDQLNNAVDKDEGYLKKRLALVKLQEEKGILESAKWSAADKSEKLNRLSLTLKVGDIEDAVIEHNVNRVGKRKSTKKLIE